MLNQFNEPLFLVRKTLIAVNQTV